RDFYRLHSLQKLMPGAVLYTLNQQPVSGVQAQSTHTYASINRRGAQDLAKRFPHVRFQYILLDYMRFPGIYMVQAYGDICKKHGFLDTLAQKGLITPQTEIWIPHLRGLDPFCIDQKRWKIEPVSASTNP